jgi:hypothetical protein
MKNRAETPGGYTDTDNDLRSSFSMLQRYPGHHIFTSTEFKALGQLVEFAEFTLHTSSKRREAVAIVRDMMRKAAVIYDASPKTIEEQNAEFLAKLEQRLQEVISGNSSPRGIVADDVDPEKN